MKQMILAAIAAALMAGPAFAQAMTPAEYVMTAGASDMYERDSSMIVAESTTDPRVREFARMMIAHHTKSTADVKATAAQSRVRAAPPRLMPVQAEMIAQLTAETGAARDAAYIAQQKAAHNQALEVQKAYAEGGSAPALRRAAAGIVPVVMSHIEMLKKM
ncbi:MAG: DUF4142 domain-containing protein [Pseudomonadota bacterium]